MRTRLGRASFFYYSLADNMLFASFLSLLAIAAIPWGHLAFYKGLAQILMAVVLLILFTSNIRNLVRRLHDLGKSGWTFLLLMVPLVNFYFMFQIFFKRGEEGTNRWGDAESLSQNQDARRTALVTLFMAVISITPAVIFSQGHLKKNFQDKTAIRAAIAAGQELHSSKDLSEKEMQFTKALAADPCNAELSYQLGQVHIEAGNFDRVETLYHKFVEQCGDYLDLRWLVYQAAKEEGDFIQAERLVSQLIKDFPRDKDYLVWRGLLYENAEQNEKAIRDYERALELAPKLTSVPLNLSRLYQKTGESCLAFETLKRYLKQYPEMQSERSLLNERRKLGRSCRRAKLKAAASH